MTEQLLLSLFRDMRAIHDHSSCGLQSSWKEPRKGDSSMNQDTGSALGKKEVVERI